jgi:hypothetical protein
LARQRRGAEQAADLQFERAEARFHRPQPVIEIDGFDQRHDGDDRESQHQQSKQDEFHGRPRCANLFQPSDCRKREEAQRTGLRWHWSRCPQIKFKRIGRLEA